MSPNIKLLQAVRDDMDQDYPSATLLRVLVNDTDIKYITLEPTVCRYRKLPTEYGAQIGYLSPPLPQQEWNQATLDRGYDGTPCYTDIEDVDRPKVRQTWHQRFVNYTDLKFYTIKPSRKVYRVVSDQTFDGKQAVAKFGWNEKDIEKIAKETKTYMKLQGHHVAPEFLGHIVEHGRIIGFLLENLGTRAHPETEEDDKACTDVIDRLHKLGLAHGNAVTKNFLVKRDQAFLISFKKAHRIEIEEDLDF